MRANDLTCFSFTKIGNGCYKVRYTTPVRDDYYEALIDDMTLIDSTKNAYWAKSKDIELLRYHVKQKGKHFSKTGTPIRI